MQNGDESRAILKEEGRSWENKQAQKPASISQLLGSLWGHCYPPADETGNFLSSHGLPVTLGAVKYVYK